MEIWKTKRIEIMKEILNIIGENYILKGGTALMLYYGLDRFSEDIDLDSKTNNLNILSKLENYSKKNNKNWKFNIKKNTDTVFRIMLDYGEKNEKGLYPLKIEISNRNKNLIINNVLNYTIINGVNVYNLEEILSMKTRAFNNRDKIRDFYDISFYIEKEPIKFNENDLLNIKEKLDYTDMEVFEKLLNNEFKENNLKDIDAEKIIINTYEKVEELILENKRNKWNKKDNNISDRDKTSR
ncbi:nucleotidyl transferase AbiEii/AbiGii toxin family protein [Streptobacillus felis]|uniref:nucleotidyl transferase AbiEii/AbiGii toxin family protein n=1 Tax=Streptobacillus felis TaxID=1384509 RepID=UPI0008330441|nr:nucleotidyl transferase AbiEii/AbiGii toxin family protein [Streptobacillus felis]